VSVGQDEKLPSYFFANDWTKIDGEDLLQRIGCGEMGPFIDAGGWGDKKRCAAYGTLVRPIIGTNGVIFGRACIRGSASYTRSHIGVVTVGGFCAKHIPGIGGILVGTPQTAARDSALPIVPAELLSSWASEQAILIAGSSLSGEAKLQAAGVVMQCGGAPGNLPILKCSDDYPTLEELRNLLVGLKQFKVYEGSEIDYDEDQDQCHPREFAKDFEVEPSIAFLYRMPGTILGVEGKNWPECILEQTEKLTYETQLRRILTEIWGGYEDWSCDNVKVGTAGGWDIERTVTVYTRPDEEPKL
jgi:hypothetical protein